MSSFSNTTRADLLQGGNPQEAQTFQSLQTIILQNAQTIAHNERVVTATASAVEATMATQQHLQSRMDQTDAQRNLLERRFRKIEEQNKCLLKIGTLLFIIALAITIYLLVRK